MPFLCRAIYCAGTETKTPVVGGDTSPSINTKIVDNAARGLVQPSAAVASFIRLHAPNGADENDNVQFEKRRSISNISLLLPNARVSSLNAGFIVAFMFSNIVKHY